MFQNIINRIVGQSSNKYVNYEDIQRIQGSRHPGYFLINTLPYEEQNCLIQGTVKATDEEQLINERLKSTDKSRVHFLIYGRNSIDDTVNRKYAQITKMGYNNVFIYSGGLFEWLLLQDIYGEDNFTTTASEINILKYKPPSFMRNSIMNF